MSLRVLHLIDPRHAGWPALRALAILQQAPTPDIQHAVALIGGPPQRDLAAAIGLRWDVAVAPPLIATELAGAALRRHLRADPRPDLIHTWSLPGLALARALSPQTPRSVTLGAPDLPSSAAIHALARRAALRAAARVLCTSRWAAEQWQRILRTSEPPISVLPFPLGAAPDPAQRARIRAEWEIADDIRVIAAVGEPESRLDGRWFAFRAGVLAVGGVPSAVLLPRSCESLERALRFTERHHHAWKVIIDDRPLPQVLPACDVALWRAGVRGPGSEPSAVHGLALASAAGLPCVAEDHPLSRELLTLPNPPILLPPRDTVAKTRAIFDAVDSPPPHPAQRPQPDPETWRQNFSTHLHAAATKDPSPLMPAA